MRLPRLRVTEADGDSWDDPPEGKFADLIGELTPERRFLIVERHDRPSLWQHFIQVYLDDDLTYRVEYREGGPHAHFQAQAAERAVVTEVVVGWAFDRDGWRDALPWALWEPE